MNPDDKEITSEIKSLCCLLMDYLYDKKLWVGWCTLRGYDITVYNPNYFNGDSLKAETSCFAHVKVSQFEISVYPARSNKSIPRSLAVLMEKLPDFEVAWSNPNCFELVLAFLMERCK